MLADRKLSFRQVQLLGNFDGKPQELAGDQVVLGILPVLADSHKWPEQPQADASISQLSASGQRVTASGHVHIRTPLASHRNGLDQQRDTEVDESDVAGQRAAHGVVRRVVVARRLRKTVDSKIEQAAQAYSAERKEDTCGEPVGYPVPAIACA